MKDTLKRGMEHKHFFTVSENQTAPNLYPEDPHFQTIPKVFGTGFMVGLIEITCMQALANHLEEGEGSVGIHIDVSHISPTPPGMDVEVAVKVSEVDGNKITWDISAKDQKDVIGTGKHQRYVVNWERFQKKVATKQ